MSACATMRAKFPRPMNNDASRRGDLRKGFIKNATVLVRRVGNAPDDILRLFGSLSPDYDYVNGIANVADCAPNSDALLVPIDRVRIDD